MLIDAPYPVAKTLQEGGFVLIPHDSLVEYAGLYQNQAFGDRAQATLLYLLSTSERDADGNRICRLRPVCVSDDLGLKRNVIETRMGTLEKHGTIEKVSGGKYVPPLSGMESPLWEAAVYRILPEWTEDVMTDWDMDEGK